MPLSEEDKLKILIVDNDRDLVEMLNSWLKTLGYQVFRAYTGKRAELEWEAQKPDLVIMETDLEDVDPFETIRDMQRKHNAYVIITTDGRKDIQHEVRCLESGADDYVRKPYYPSQLLSHIRAISRRSRFGLKPQPPSIISVGHITLDSQHNEATVNGKTIQMTPTESKLLQFLAINVNQVCTSEQIVSRIWGLGDDGVSSLIKAHIRHLRQKIEPDPSYPRYILTVPGIGYMLTDHPIENTSSLSLNESSKDYSVQRKTS